MFNMYLYTYIHMFATNNYAKPQNSNVIKQPLFKQFKIRQAKVFNDIIMMFGHEQRRSDHHDVTLKRKKIHTQTPRFINFYYQKPMG